MLSNRDLYAEIEAIEKRMESLPDGPVKDGLKIGTLQLKLLHNIRANTVTVMRHFEIELLKSPLGKKDEEQKDKSQEKEAE